VGPLSPRHDASSGADGGGGLQVRRVTAIMINKCDSQQGVILKFDVW
jgi:hypothetical protein